MYTRYFVQGGGWRARPDCMRAYLAQTHELNPGLDLGGGRRLGVLSSTRSRRFACTRIRACTCAYVRVSSEYSMQLTHTHTHASASVYTHASIRGPQERIEALLLKLSNSRVSISRAASAESRRSVRSKQRGGPSAASTRPQEARANRLLLLCTIIIRSSIIITNTTTTTLIITACLTIIIMIIIIIIIIIVIITVLRASRAPAVFVGVAECAVVCDGAWDAGLGSRFCWYVGVCIYIYIYIEREREGERGESRACTGGTS